MLYSLSKIMKKFRERDVSSLLTKNLMTWLEREVNKSLHMPYLLSAPSGTYTYSLSRYQLIQVGSFKRQFIDPPYFYNFSYSRLWSFIAIARPRQSS